MEDGKDERNNSLENKKRTKQQVTNEEQKLESSEQEIKEGSEICPKEKRNEVGECLKNELKKENESFFEKKNQSESINYSVNTKHFENNTGSDNLNQCGNEKCDKDNVPGENLSQNTNPTLGASAEDLKANIVEMMVNNNEVHKDENKFDEYSPDKRYGRLPVVLGHGSQKLVYKAMDTYDAQEVAWSVVEVKDCPTSFLNEINLLKAIQHPNIIKLKDFWYNENQLIFITELMTSGTLRQYIKTLSPSLRVIKGWAKQILLAIEHLHSKSMIHRDIKCENIFINGSTGEVKIGDLGIAKKSKQKRYTIVGTPEFMAREVFEGDGYGEGVDVYAFGMALLEMSIREYPYTECASPHEIFKRVMSGIPPLGLFLVTDACLRDLIIKCIAAEEVRISIKDCLNHHFIIDESDSLEGIDESSSFKSGCKECLDFFTHFTFPSMTLPSNSTLTAVSFKGNIVNLQLYYKEKDRFIKFEFDILSDTEESIFEEMITEKIFKKSQSQWMINIMKQGLIEIKERIKQFRKKDDIFYKWANGDDLTEYRESNTQKITQKIFNVNEASNETEIDNDEIPTTPTLTDVDFPKKNYPDETPICDFVRETSLITKRDIETANTWIKTLKVQEIYKICDLRILVDEDWDLLGLTVFSSRAMKNMLYGKDKHPAKEKDLSLNSCVSFDDTMTIEDFMLSISGLIEREIPSEWIDKLLKEDVRNVGELRSLTVCDWERFDMSVFAKRIIKNIVFRKGKIVKGYKII